MKQTFLDFFYLGHLEKWPGGNVGCQTTRSAAALLADVIRCLYIGQLREQDCDAGV